MHAYNIFKFNETTHIPKQLAHKQIHNYIEQRDI